MTPAYLFPSKYSGQQAASGGLSLGTLRQTILLHVQQLRLNPVAQHELLVARKLVQLRDQIDQQVLPFRQNVVAIGQVSLTKNNFTAARSWFLI